MVDNLFPNYYFILLGVFAFCEKGNFAVDTILVKLASSQRLAQLLWKLVLHNFSQHNYFIWNNKDIHLKKKKKHCSVILGSMKGMF